MAVLDISKTKNRFKELANEAGKKASQQAGGVLSAPKPQPQITPRSVSPIANTPIKQPQEVQANIAPSDTDASQSLIDQNINYNQKVMAGQDVQSQRLLSGMMEQNAATQAALRGASAQRGKLQGLSGTAQNIMADMQDRQLATQESEQYGTLADTLGRRVDQANQALGQIGQVERDWEYNKASKVLQDMEANMDFSDPQNVANYKAQYKEAFGVDPSMDQMIEKQWDAKQLKADTEWMNYTLDNEANFYDADGNFNSNYALSDPKSLQILGDKWDADTSGMLEPFDPSNPDHKAWAENQFKKNTTNETELAMKKAWSDIQNSNMFANLPDDQKLEVEQDWEAMSLMAQAGWVPKVENGVLGFYDAGGNPVMSGSDFMVIGDTSVKLDTTANTATIGGEEYEIENGVWYDEDGEEVDMESADGKVLGNSNVADQFTTIQEKAGIDTEIIDYTTEVTPGQIADLTTSKDTENIHKLLASDNIGELSLKDWESLRNNEEFMNSVKDQAKSWSFPKDEDGKWVNPPEVGDVFVNGAGDLVVVTSPVKTTGTLKKPNQLFSYKYLYGGDKKDHIHDTRN